MYLPVKPEIKNQAKPVEDTFPANSQSTHWLQPKTIDSSVSIPTRNKKHSGELMKGEKAIMGEISWEIENSF